jgi:hypothetical protein
MLNTLTFDLLVQREKNKKRKIFLKKEERETRKKCSLLSSIKS